MEAMKLVTAGEMQTIEKHCVESGISEDDLMENAGLAVAERIREHRKWNLISMANGYSL